ncbi:unnamed protein product [Durusdinium trenchii]|uniref:Uncharacterized protein n=1 Tax=Durusdinium trenchii TaxID=1381693 RepID=A0ABP0JE93_9DINO
MATFMAPGSFFTVVHLSIGQPGGDLMGAMLFADSTLSFLATLVLLWARRALWSRSFHPSHWDEPHDSRQRHRVPARHDSWERPLAALAGIPIGAQIEDRSKGKGGGWLTLGIPKRRCGEEASSAAWLLVTRHPSLVCQRRSFEGFAQSVCGSLTQVPLDDTPGSLVQFQTSLNLAHPVACSTHWSTEIKPRSPTVGELAVPSSGFVWFRYLIQLVTRRIVEADSSFVWDQDV